MKIEIPLPAPRADGEFAVHVSKGYGNPHGTIALDDKWELVLNYVSAEDCDGLIRAADEVKSKVLAYRAERDAPHGTAHLHKGHCQLCGKPEDDPLHAPAITDSGRTCGQANPGSGAWCHRDGDHGVHEDTDGQTWRTDGLRCECSHAQDEHDDADDSDAGRAPHECLRPGCGCGRYRPAAPSPHGEPPAVVNGDVVLEVRALLS